MQAAPDSVKKLVSLASTPNSPELRKRMEELRGVVAEHLTSASQTEAEFFREAGRAIQKLPANAAPDLQAELILDIARYFYLAGLPFEAIEPLVKAEALAAGLGQRALIGRVASTLGVIFADTGNLSRAIEKYAEALEAAQACGDHAAEANVWVNLGVVLHYCAEYESAIACFRRAVDMAKGEPDLKRQKISALSNIALASLHLEKYQSGLSAAKEALSEVDEPHNAGQMFSRVLLEKNTARLFMETNSLEEAKNHVERAKHFAMLSKSPRAELEASIAEGLYLVHAGHFDLGISRLKATLEKARFLRSALRDVLVALVRAYEITGQPDHALIYLRELKENTKKTHEENALRHLKLHLQHVDMGLEHNTLPTSNLEKHEALLGKKLAEQELFKSRIEMLERLAVTAELRDDSTGEHSYRVGKLAALLAADYGCDEEAIFMIDLAARLHDIGKIAVPDAILLKPDKLNDAEREIMRTHTTVGAELLSKSNITHMQMAEDIARYHHEWWDGNGYPGNCSGNSIPLAARITALADVYDALTHKRPYKEPWPVEATISEIASLKGRQFDPELTDLFMALIARLRREHSNLDTYLGQAAFDSPFLQARSKIREALHRGSLGENTASGSRLDLQR